MEWSRALRCNATRWFSTFLKYSLKINRVIWPVPPVTSFGEEIKVENCSLMKEFIGPPETIRSTDAGHSSRSHRTYTLYSTVLHEYNRNCMVHTLDSTRKTSATFFLALSFFVFVGFGFHERRDKWKTDLKRRLECESRAAGRAEVLMIRRWIRTIVTKIKFILIPPDVEKANARVFSCCVPSHSPHADSPNKWYSKFLQFRCPPTFSVKTGSEVAFYSTNWQSIAAVVLRHWELQELNRAFETPLALPVHSLILYSNIQVFFLVPQIGVYEYK